MAQPPGWEYKEEWFYVMKCVHCPPNF
jgi:hypothetical protein